MFNKMKVHIFFTKKSKTVYLQGFWPKSVYLKCFGNQLKTVHLQGPHSSRPCISRPCCTYCNAENSATPTGIDFNRQRCLTLAQIHSNSKSGLTLKDNIFSNMYVPIKNFVAPRSSKCQNRKFSKYPHRIPAIKKAKRNAKTSTWHRT